MLAIVAVQHGTCEHPSPTFTTERGEVFGGQTLNQLHSATARPPVHIV